MTTPLQKKQLQEWFYHLRNRICLTLEQIEAEADHLELPAGRFIRQDWKRQDQAFPQREGGGGTMAILKGRVFEKAGVNISTVYGTFLPPFAKEIPGAEVDPGFWASGLSLVLHPLNPFIPTVHMNTRHIVTTQAWFGGGADLTPAFDFSEDTADFHHALRQACDQHDADYYPRFKAACDTYFYLPHRQEARGVGGIFYDYLYKRNLAKDSPESILKDFDKGFTFTKDVGEAFLAIYPDLVRRHMRKPWTKGDKEKQKIKRSRYVEFNLLYDRGTHFGLKTGGNIEAILMSLPPEASWT